jgi:hypothetical protein
MVGRGAGTKLIRSITKATVWMESGRVVFRSSVRDAGRDAGHFDIRTRPDELTTSPRLRSASSAVRSVGHFRDFFVGIKRGAKPAAPAYRTINQESIIGFSVRSRPHAVVTVIRHVLTRRGITGTDHTSTKL